MSSIIMETVYVVFIICASFTLLGVGAVCLATSASIILDMSND